MPHPKPEASSSRFWKYWLASQTIVYGYFALMFMTPLLRSIFGKDVVEIYNTASAGLVMAS